MALIKHATSSAVTTTGAERRKFKLDSASTDQIISLLTNMYPRPIWSSVREVIQNALDAKKDGKISIHLPTAYNPVFECRDSGTGLDSDGFVSMIGNIGASDKRGDASKIGCFGIGSIAPCCIAESMSMTSFQSGVATTLNIVKDDEGRIEYQLEEPKSGFDQEPDGMLVSVPFPVDMHEQVKNAVHAFKFSAELAKRMIVDECPLTPNNILSEDEVQVGAHKVLFRIVEGQTDVLPGALILLNGVPLGASAERFPELAEFCSFMASRESAQAKRKSSYSGSTIVVKVPPEAGLSFPPSREVIAVTRLNSAFLKNAVARYFEAAMKDLKDNGLKLGSEGAAALFWRAEALSAGKKLAEVRHDVQKKLDAMSPYFVVSLQESWDYNSRSNMPTVTLIPRIPYSCNPRSLEINEPYNRKTGKSGWNLATCGLVPVDPNDEKKGYKLPFSSNRSITLVTWDKIKTEHDGDWSGVTGKVEGAKAALFDIGVGLDTGQRRSTILLAEPLPSDHPLSVPGNPKVDFETMLATPRQEGNPYLKTEEDEEDEETETVNGVKRAKQKIPRQYFTEKGTEDRFGLPKEKPFVYVEILRDYYTRNNSAGLPLNSTYYYNDEEGMRSWLQMFNASGISDNLDAVILRPSEVNNIKRPHVKLVDKLSELVKEWVAGLTVAERHHLPYGIFRVYMARTCPDVLAYFDTLSDRGAGDDDKVLGKFLRVCKDAPTQKLELFYNALAKYNNREDVWAQFRSVIDNNSTTLTTTQVHSGLSAGDTVFGFSRYMLAIPRLRLKAWMDKNSDTAKWTKVMFAYWNNTSKNKSAAMLAYKWGRMHETESEACAADIGMRLL